MKKNRIKELSISSRHLHSSVCSSKLMFALDDQFNQSKAPQVKGEDEEAHKSRDIEANQEQMRVGMRQTYSQVNLATEIVEKKSDGGEEPSAPLKKNLSISLSQPQLGFGLKSREKESKVKDRDLQKVID